MVVLHEAWAKIEFSEEKKTLYISGKKGVIIRIAGLNIPDDVSNFIMLDITANDTEIVVVGGASTTQPGQD